MADLNEHAPSTKIKKEEEEKGQEGGQQIVTPWGRGGI
jgi:hypothetical protein